MESWKNSYYLRDLDDFIISGSNGGRNDSEAKVEHSPFIPITTANDDNVGELDPENPNPVKPPARGTKPIDTEPAPDNPPGNGNTPGDTDDNPIEPNPNNPPIKKPKPAEPTPTPPPEPAPTDPKPGQDETQPPENDGGGNGRNDGDDRDGDDDSIERGDHRDDDDNNSNSGTGGGNGNNGENQTPPAAGNTGNNGNTGNQTTPSPADTKSSADPNTGNGRNKDILSPRERGKAALLAKMDTDFASQVESSWLNGKAIAVDKQLNDYSSPIIAIDVNGRYIEMNNFNVDGMDISIKREHDGYGNEFDSVRTIESLKLTSGQVVKCNIQDMVGANAESKAFADEHGGMTLPDGKYHFTAKNLTKQSDGTYNSIKFANTLQLQTKDTTIPEHIRNDINAKYYLFHATEYKEGYIPEDGGNRIWINPWSAGCISSITGGQSTHDDFMNMLTGITPENISVTITSKRHVDI